MGGSVRVVCISMISKEADNTHKKERNVTTKKKQKKSNNPTMFVCLKTQYHVTKSPMLIEATPETDSLFTCGLMQCNTIKYNIKISETG